MDFYRHKHRARDNREKCAAECRRPYPPASAHHLPHPAVYVNAQVGRDNAEIEYICAQRQNPAVLKDQTLNGEYGCHDNEAYMGPEKNCQEHPPAKMAAGSRKNGKIYHLGCEYECPHDARKRNFALIKFSRGSSSGVDENPARNADHCRARRRTHEFVAHMHEKNPFPAGKIASADNMARYGVTNLIIVLLIRENVNKLMRYLSYLLGRKQKFVCAEPYISN